MMKFKLVKDESKKKSYLLGEVYFTGDAGFYGWGIAVVGFATLEVLAVGQTTIDDDGDTWERVE